MLSFEEFRAIVIDDYPTMIEIDDNHGIRKFSDGDYRAHHPQNHVAYVYNARSGWTYDGGRGSLGEGDTLIDAQLDENACYESALSNA